MLLGILVVLFFISTADVTENKILVAQHPLLVVSNQTATLVCNYTYNGTGKEFRASLHKGTDSSVEVCFISWNVTNIRSNSTKEFNCQGDHDKDKVIFNLWNMNANQTDIYFCKIEVMYPPPYVYNEKSNGTVIHVKETPIQIQEPQSTIPLWILATVTGILALYSMLITAGFFNYWYRMTVFLHPSYVCTPMVYPNRAETPDALQQKSKKRLYHQSDYMNMTPRHPPYKNKGYPSYAPTRDYTAYRSWQP
ncbi:T-cell-specific surface glycoprotein CD28 isoform X1 [Zonotrichia leucophrys gambelii]|uniref:T-cell-specific surface glycoprotein CD28 isoform X1 n=1 Tax=Zonotrichia leucophrys gambelii TaxID=257770 RepID=UPI003140484C